MSRTGLPSGVATDAAAFGYRAVRAVEIGFPTPVRITDAGASVMIDGDTYTNGRLAISGLDVGGAQCSIEVSNITNAISTPDLATGALGITVTVYEVYWSSGGTQRDPVTLLTGKVTGCQWDAEVATLTVTVTAMTQHGMVGRVVSRLCTNAFKGERCAYAGATTVCDHTFAACTALSNTAKFNGYRTMPQIGTIFRYRLVREAPASSHTGSLPRRPVIPPQVPAVGRQIRRKLVRGRPIRGGL